MKAKSIKGKSAEEIQLAFQQSMADGFKPTLAIVFMSYSNDLNAVSSLLNNYGVSVFGASSAGEFIDGDIGEGGVAVMVLDISPDYFKLLFLETEGTSTLELAKKVGYDGKRYFDHPAFMIASGGITTDGEKIVEGIEAAIGSEATIFGGMAGDDLRLTETYVFTNGKISNNGLVALIIDEDRIEMRGLATCGWKPVGTIRTVTKSSGNVVYTIDNEPALDMVIKYMGVDIDLDSRKDVVMNIGAYFPLQLERENGVPVMRTAMFVNKDDRSLLCAGNVPQGSKLRFSLPPDFDVINKVVGECLEIKKIDLSDADATIMFSCISRHLSFGDMASEEIEQVRKVWNAPLIGFFSYGEIGKSKRGKHEFHNNTCCVVALKEK